MVTRVGPRAGEANKNILNHKKKGRGRHKKSISPMNRRQSVFTEGRVRGDGRGKV